MGSFVLRTFGAAALPMVVLLTIALGGVDFGRYWDDEAMASKVQRAIGPPLTLLPYAYDYPGVSFWMALAAIGPEARHSGLLRQAAADPSELRAFLQSRTYYIRARVIFAVVSSLVVVWVSALSLALGAACWEAALAAALLATSWEVAYHVRWIAPDGVMMQFIALAALCAVMSLGPGPRRFWLVPGSVAAGLATASKYSGWPMVVCVALAGWLSAPVETTIRQRATTTVQLGLASVAAFLVVSPGTLLQPVLAAGAIRAQVNHYANGHGVYTVVRGVDHLERMMGYLTLVLPSPYAAVALVSTAAALFGAYALTRSSPRIALVLLGFPLCYIAYFAIQRVMVVRNLIVLAPFGAVLAARGLGAAWSATRDRGLTPLRVALVTGAVAALALDLSFNASAVDGIRRRNPQRTLDEFSAWLAAQPSGSVELSDRLQQELGRHDASSASGEPDVAMYALDAKHQGIRPNERTLFKCVFGPREVNLNYYSDWIGDEHIVVLTRRQAVRFGVVDR